MQIHLPAFTGPSSAEKRAIPPHVAFSNVREGRKLAGPGALGDPKLRFYRITAYCDTILSFDAEKREGRKRPVNGRGRGVASLPQQTVI